MKAPSLAVLATCAVSTAAIVHPGLLHTDDDFERIRSKVDAGAEPWATGLQKLANRADANWTPNPQETICRGGNAGCTENYAVLFRDVHAAYANAVYWKITGNTTHADTAVKIIDAWSSTMKVLTGSTDAALAAGIYGYQLSNTAEILRTYDGWSGLDAITTLLYDVFYEASERFLRTKNGQPPDHYWANWDLCSLSNIHALGVLSDNQTMIDSAINYFKTADGMGAIENAIWEIHEEEGSGKRLGQNQEAGRDQGHATLVFALISVLAQQSYNQGEDLFDYLDQRILAGSEYLTKYNTGHDVPFTTYTNKHGTATEISEGGRGTIRPFGELLYAHYNGVKGLDAGWTKAYRDLVVEQSGGAEGGGGDYGGNSGGYDQLGFGTLLFRLDE